MSRFASMRVVLALSTGRAELPDSIALVVAHPDDEVIGVGGRLASWAERTTIVHVTDGAPLDGADARASGCASREEYAEARRRETSAALGWLPRQPVAIVPLGLVDQGLTYALDDLVSRLRRLVLERAPPVIVTHAYEGGHPDHDAIAFAVQLLCADARLPRFEVVEFAAYHEGPGEALVTNRFAESTQPDGRRAARLTPLDRRRKRLMIGCLQTQRRTLQPFTCDQEWLRPAPRYDFSQAPGAHVWFDRFAWGVTGERWRALAADAAARLRGASC
jgi:LmbE family N-acetylglucosaminyl deacetylase